MPFTVSPLSLSQSLHRENCSHVAKTEVATFAHPPIDGSLLDLAEKLEMDWLKREVDLPSRPSRLWIPALLGHEGGAGKL